MPGVSTPQNTLSINFLVVQFLFAAHDHNHIHTQPQEVDNRRVFMPGVSTPQQTHYQLFVCSIDVCSPHSHNNIHTYPQEVSAPFVTLHTIFYEFLQC